MLIRLSLVNVVAFLKVNKTFKGFFKICKCPAPSYSTIRSIRYGETIPLKMYINVDISILGKLHQKVINSLIQSTEVFCASGSYQTASKTENDMVHFLYQTFPFCHARLYLFCFYSSLEKWSFLVTLFNLSFVFHSLINIYRDNKRIYGWER